jgi:hypothetical protein
MQEGFISIVLNLVFHVNVFSQYQTSEVQAATQGMQREVPEGYIGIYSVSDLNKMRENVGGKYIFMTNIDLSEATSEGGEFYRDGKGWEPIGTPDTYFKGIFDGNGYTIKGLTINNAASAHSTYAGLFGYCYLAEFMNIRLEDVQITVENTLRSQIGKESQKGVFAGAIAGSIQDSKVTNSKVN